MEESKLDVRRIFADALRSDVITQREAFEEKAKEQESLAAKIEVADTAEVSALLEGMSADVIYNAVALGKSLK